MAEPTSKLTAPSRMPEYESATADLTTHLVHEVMHARNPMLALIRHEHVDHVPTGNVPGEVAVGFSRGIEAEFSLTLDVSAIIDTDLEAWATMISDAADN